MSLWNDILTALRAEDASGAVTRILGATRRPQEDLPHEPEAHGLRDAFFGFLSRRGYLVGSPREIRATVDEIRAVGAGFDLFDVARALAEYDQIVTECLGLRPRRILPELAAFSVPCACGKHPRIPP